MPDVDQDARDQVADVRHDLANHKMVTDIKLDNVVKTLAELRSQLKWAGGLIVMLFLSTLTWSLTQQYNANEGQKKDMQAQLDLLREQDRSRQQYRTEILSRLPPSGSEAADAATRVTEGRDLKHGKADDGSEN